MKVLEIEGSTGHSVIMIGESLRKVSPYIPCEKAVIVTDTNVRNHYLKWFPDHEIIVIDTGEGIKNLMTVQEIYERLLELGADRSTFILGIGGGVLCDIAGFVASTYMRGLRFGFVSTTLLSQVDASVGGKNGVNFAGYKNIVGVFNQPEFVIADLSLLATLPEREKCCGFAEIVKHAAIGDAGLFSYLEQHWKKALDLDTEVIEKLVFESVLMKSSIVGNDEKEKGERKKLNFGHTLGHAIEKTTAIPHGEAVSLGMVLAARISTQKGYLRAGEVERLEKLLKKLKLPTRAKLDKDALFSALMKDKKREGEIIHLVLLEGLGNAIIEPMTVSGVKTLLEDLTDYLQPTPGAESFSSEPGGAALDFSLDRTDDLSVVQKNARR